MIFTPAIFHDFNSVMKGDGKPGEAALSFAAQASTSPPVSSPGPHTSWTGYTPPPPPDHKQQQQPQQQQQQQPGQQGQQGQQFYPQNPTLGFDHMTGSTAPIPIPQPSPGLPPYSQAPPTPYSGPMPIGANPGTNTNTNPTTSTSMDSTTSPLTSGTLAVPPPTFAQATTNTVSAAANWSNDLVLADLILNHTTIFDVLPKLPARGSRMVDDRLSSTFANTSLSPGYNSNNNNNNNNGNNGGNVMSRPFDGTRRSSAHSGPTSPVEGLVGSNPSTVSLNSGPIWPRSDSLGPNSASRSPVNPPPDYQYQLPQYQQLPPLQNPYNEPSSSTTITTTSTTRPQGQGGRSRTPPSPSASGLKTTTTPTRSRSHMDLQPLQQQQQPKQQHQP